MKMEQTECSETAAYKIQTPENHPKENLKHSGQGESLKSRNKIGFSLGPTTVLIFLTLEDGTP